MTVRLLMFAVFIIGCQYGILVMWLYHRHKVQRLEKRVAWLERLEKRVAWLERQLKS